MAGADEERLTSDTLFLACTRPTMVMGVTLEAFIVNMFATGFLFLALRSVFYLSVAFFIHFILRQICRNDPNAFRVLFEYASTKGRCRSKRYWRASTVSPLRLRRAGSVRDLKKECCR